MKLLGRSGIAARAALLLAATVAAAFATLAAASAALAALAVLLLLVSVRRALALAGALVATAVTYGLVLAFAGGDPWLAAAAAPRFGVVLAASLWIAAETPAAAWARAAPGRSAVALASVAATLPVLSRDVEAVRDAARARGYGPLAGVRRASPAVFVRALRRGRLADEALAQAGLVRAPARYFRHRWNAHDAVVAMLAVALAGVGFL